MVIRIFSLIYFFTISAASWSADHSEKGFLARKISQLETLARNERDQLDNRLAWTKTGAKIFCGMLALGPYVVLYYEGSLYASLTEHVRYALPPWSIITYTLTSQRSIEKTVELCGHIKNELNPFLEVAPEVIKLIELLENEVDADQPDDFFAYLEHLWQRNNTLAQFFHQIRLKALERNPDNFELDALFNKPVTWRLLVIYCLRKFFERSDEKFPHLRKQAPTISLPFVETGAMVFHSHTLLLESLASELRDNLNVPTQKLGLWKDKDDGGFSMVRKLFDKLNEPVSKKDD